MANEMRMNKLTLTVLAILGILVTLIILLNTRRGYSGSDQLIHVSQLIAASIELAERGGRKVVEIRNADNSKINQLSKGKTKEGRDEYVTLGDQVSEMKCMDALSHCNDES